MTVVWRRETRLRSGVELGVRLGGVVDDRGDLLLGATVAERGFDHEQQVLLVLLVFSHALTVGAGAVTPQ